MTVTDRAAGRVPGARALAVLMLAWAGCCQAATFTVGKTADTNDGSCNADCSLREAIVAANAAAGADTIAFAIPGGGPHTIAPTTDLPSINTPMTIDGYTQPGSVPNTATTGTNAVLRIVLSGASAPADTNGIALNAGASGSTIAGLVINGFREGIRTADPLLTVRGCFIGTNATGTAAVANDLAGIQGIALQIGGTQLADRNIVSGNGTNGISSGAGIVVQGNLLGVAADGVSALGNGSSGIVLNSGLDAVIGGTGNAANTIAFNGSDGVRMIVGTERVAVQGNRIFSNGDLGIDLDPGGPTANDALDADTGINAQQNAPVVTLAAIVPEVGVFDRLLMVGYLDSIPATSFRIEFFASDVANASGFGEGQRFLAGTQVTADANGIATIRLAPLVTAAAAQPGDFVTMTATRMESGVPIETSEFSNALTVVDGIEVTNTADTGAGSLRQALTTAAADTAANAVVFAIPGAGPHTIAVVSPLPIAGAGDLIDAYTQAGSDFNSSFDAATNATIMVSLTGVGLTPQDSALSLGTGGVLRGLAISGFQGAGFPAVDVANSDARVEGNFIGTNAAGTAPAAQNIAGVLTATRSIIGGTHRTARNLISGNGNQAVAINGPDVQVLGNVIGLAADGLSPLPNCTVNSSAGAIRFVAGNSNGTRIGLGDRDSANIIAGNGCAGIDTVVTSTGNSMRGNRIYANVAIGIDIASDGVTPNDADDADSGFNNGQNFPVLSLAQSDGVATSVIGALDRPAAPAGPLSFTIDVYASTACDTSGNGEGEFHLGGATVAIGVDDAFGATVAGAAPAGATFITTTATDANGNTSEFSACEPLVANPTLFADGFEGN